MKIYLILLILTLNIFASITCSQFTNYQQAKEYLDAKKPGYRSLDKNHDGIPCESLYKTVLEEIPVARIRIYQYDKPASYGNTYTTIEKCIKVKDKLTKSHVGTEYSYKCEEL